MNIHIYPSTFANESRILKITRSLKAHAVFERVTVLALWKDGLAKHEVLDDGIEVLRVAPLIGVSVTGWLGHLLKAVGWYFAVLWMLRGMKISCFNCHSLPVLPLSVIVKFWKRCALVYDPHELETETAGLRGGRQWLMRRLEKTLIGRADAVCVVNHSIAEWYANRYRLRKVWVVRNVPYRSESKPMRTGLLRKSLGISSEDMLFLYQGLLAPGRGIHLLIEAFSKLPLDRHLVFMGYGELAEDVKCAAAIYPNIHFMSAVSPDLVNDYTVDADIGIALIENVCQSYYLCLPNKLFEYVANGVPALVSDFPEMRRAVCELDYGWTTTPDVKHLTDFVLQLNPVDFAAKRRNAAIYGQENCWQKEESELLEIYRDLPIRKPLVDSQFFRSVSSVVGGTVLAQAIPILGTLVLARIFDPASYGVFSAWLGGVFLLAVVLTCRFESSLAVQEDGHTRENAVVFTISTVVLLSLAAGFLLFIGGVLSFEVLSRFPLALILTAIPAAATLAIAQTLLNWAAADGRYRHLTMMRVSQAALIVIFQIAAGLLFPTATSLAIGYFMGAMAGCVVGFRMMSIRRSIWSIDFMQAMTDFWQRNRKFPMFSLPADALSTATAQLPVILVASRFGMDAAGLLAMALRLLGVPMALLSASVLDVFKRHAGKAWRERGECRSEYLHALRILIVIAAVASLIIAISAEIFFEIAFGNGWVGAGSMALWLLPRFAVGFVASPLSYMVYIANKQHIDLVWQVVLLVMTLATLLIFDNIDSALLIYGFGYSILYLFYLWISYSFTFGEKVGDRC
ncbi:UNVERIFIED_ORG: O-antigen/teichoic acid export membrane protein/glycosyltransferase involved in cell wall biosynthesis [Comamonas terrigena]